MRGAGTCWNCENPLDEPLVCSRCGVPQPVGALGAYEVLGLPPKLGFEEEEIEGTYESIAHRCHPDLFRAHRDERVLAAARSAMRALNDAYRTLRLPLSRLRYALAASGRADQPTRTVPAALQSSAQIIEKVLSEVERAKREKDYEAWEAQQDHLAALQVQAEKARADSDGILLVLMTEWDEAVEASGTWPDVPEGWYERASQWLGEREYLEAIEERMLMGRIWAAEG